MRPVCSRASILVAAPRARVFTVASALEPADFVKRLGPLPGVRVTRTESGGDAPPWRAPGQVRIHELEDGTTISEELTAFAENEYFGYRVAGFEGAFARLTVGARATWRFDWRGPEKTEILWTYAFTPKSAAARPFLALLVGVFWEGYLRRALQRVKDKAEERST